MAMRRVLRPMPLRPSPPEPTSDRPVDGVPGRRRPRAYGATRLQVYLCGGHGNRLGWAFAEGARARLCELAEPPRAGWDVWLWGLLRGTVGIIATAQAGGQRWWYADHAYFCRGHALANYRVTLRGWQLNQILDVPADRWRRLEQAGARCQPWRHGGRHVLVCPPTLPVLQATGAEDWLEATLAALARHTDRPVRVRHKRIDNPPLLADLEDCHAVVTQHSVAAVEAVMHGVPAFVAPSSAAAPVAVGDISMIERPARPDREPWLRSLAYAQFHLDEFRDGRAWRILKETQGAAA